MDVTLMDLDDDRMMMLFREFRNHTTVAHLLLHYPRLVHPLTEGFWEDMALVERRLMVWYGTERWFDKHASKLTSNLLLLSNPFVRQSTRLLAKFDHLIDWRACDTHKLICVSHEYLVNIVDRLDWHKISRDIESIDNGHELLWLYDRFLGRFRHFLSESCMEHARIEIAFTNCDF